VGDKMKRTLTIAILFIPILCYANAGTPLLWAMALQLYGVNILIGILEYFLINKFFYSIRKRYIFATIAMNYLSMFCGAFLNDIILKQYNLSLFDPKSSKEYIIENILWYVIFTVLSIIIEWPAIKFIIKKTMKESFLISMKINLISSLLVVALILFLTFIPF
jgi:hypothetical protein